MDVIKADIDVGDVIAVCLRMVQDRINAGSLDLSAEVPGDLPVLRADGRLVRQILLNLLSNAIKFTPTGGHVGVSAEADDEGAVILIVADTGIGIAPEDRSNALTKFGQVESTYTRQHQGAGLGLPLVKSLIELHGGTLALDSTVGVGTTVTLRFPADRIIRSN